MQWQMRLLYTLDQTNYTKLYTVWADGCLVQSLLELLQAPAVGSNSVTSSMQLILLALIIQGDQKVIPQLNAKFVKPKVPSKDFSQIKVTFESILTLKKVHHVVKLGSWSSLLKSLKSKSLNSETRAELMLLSQYNQTSYSRSHLASERL